MTRDTIFQAEAARAADFEFNAEVADAFDDMVERSVPFYHEQQALIRALAGEYWRPNTTAYDLGCSTGTTLLTLAEVKPEGARLVGYDNSDAMLSKARVKIDSAGKTAEIELRVGDFDSAAGTIALDQAGFVCMAWTLQFVRPMKRLELLRHVYEEMKGGGAFVICEKVLATDATLNRQFVDLYYRYKRSQGYTDGEIARKREALENVLVPYRVDENVDLLREAGFEVVETCFQWLNFAAFLCVKRG